MKPLRKHVAISIDGGGLKGVVATRALMALEKEIGLPLHAVCRLTTGTSTGAIIAAGLAAGVPLEIIDSLYVEQGPIIFRPSLRSKLWPIHRFRFGQRPLKEALELQVGDMKMGYFYRSDPQTNVVLTTFDLVTQKTCFIKPWKEAYRDWRVVDAILASSAVPSILPVVNGRYIDGGIGSYANPAYLAAYEIAYLLEWNLSETTLISIGTGRNPAMIKENQADKYFPWQWLMPLLGGFMQSADDQQVHIVQNFFQELDFRRFQIDFDRGFNSLDPKEMPELIAYGERLGQKILRNESEPEIFPTPMAINSVINQLNGMPIPQN